jgi:hypothetical protein
MMTQQINAGKKKQELKVPLMWCIFILGYFSLSARGNTKKKKR